MLITFFGARKYDRESFDAIKDSYPDLEFEYWDAELTPKSAPYVKEGAAVCAFVNADCGRETLCELKDRGVKLLLMRCAGFNNVDLGAATEFGITVMRVPGYSPEAVAELAITLATGVNRKIHKAYVRVRENNYSLVGLVGFDLHGKTAGIVGTGRIGAAMARICRGFGMNVIAYDMYQNPALDFVKYVDMDTLLAQSDLISLHCPLSDSTKHMINIETIHKMKDGVILVNTSRGGLINTADLVQGIREKKFHGVGLDVYEEEGVNVFENHEDDIMPNSVVADLLSFPNVIITSHQGFFTKEALSAIAHTTLDNAMAFLKGEKSGTELN